MLWTITGLQMQFPVIIDLGTTLAKAHFNINSKGHFCRNLKKHILLGCDVNMLGIVNYVQYNGVVEHKLLPVSSLNISILNETIHQIQFVRAHDSFLILKDWRRCELKTKWYILQTCCGREPVPDFVFLLVENDELVFTTCKNNINIEFVFTNL